MKTPFRTLPNLLLCCFILLASSLLLVHFTARPHYADYVPDFISRPTSNNVDQKQSPELDLDTATGPKLPAEYASFYPTLTLPAALLVHPELYQRLFDFLSRPVLSHLQALEINEKQCPRELSDKLVNPDQLQGDGDFWREEVREEVIRRKRVDMVNHLAELVKRGETVVWKTEHLDPDEMDVIGEIDDGDFREIIGEAEGKSADDDQVHRTAKRTVVETQRGTAANQHQRGIVTTGGNADTTSRLITLLRFLRNEYNLTLPIEVWTFPGELPRASSQYTEITDLGGTVLEVPTQYGIAKDKGAWKNFQIKGLAIALSSFRELVYLDSDNIPLRDPTYLFDTASYTKQGAGRAAFWPDLSKDHVDNAVWRVMGVPCDLEDFTFESGQIVIDKAGSNGLNMAALHLAAYMQHEKDFWFRLCGGDKDTFRWAFVALGLPFTRASRWATCLGQMHNGRFCGHTVLQYELDPPAGETRQRPLFAHSNLLKHISGVQQGDTFTHIKRMSNDVYSEPTLNQAHMWVYWDNARGMCTDLELRDEGAGLTDAEKKTQSVLSRRIDEMDGKPLEGFEDMFFKYGGRAGGWRKRDKYRIPPGISQELSVDD